MRTARVAVGLVFVIAMAAGAQTSQERKAIAFAKAIPVSQLDSKLSSIPFERWLTTVAGAGAQMTWEVNDCGEQTGTTVDNGRDFPMCVEVNAQMRDQREIVVSIAVGSFKLGIFGKPSTWWITAGYDSATDRGLEKLSDVPARLSGTPVATPVHDVPASAGAKK